MINGMTEQQAFDKAVGGIIKQGKLSYDDDGHVCLYNQPDGSKCIVGQIMTEDQLKNTYDNSPVEELVGYYPKYEGWADHVELLSAMQEAHDTPAGEDFAYDNWLRRIKLVADRFNLSWNHNV